MSAASVRLRPFESLYNVLKRSAGMRKRDVLLSYDEFVEFTSTSSCQYCGASVLWVPYMNDTSFKGYNLDRKDNAVGYSKENCVVCCSRCNRAKSDSFTHEEWVAMTAALKEFHETNNR